MRPIDLNNQPYLNIKRVAFAFGCVFLSNQASAVPHYATTKLPLDPRMSMESDALKFVLKQDVHQDAQDPNQYYFRPVFRAVGKTRAATVLINRDQLRLSAKLEDIIDALYSRIG